MAFQIVGRALALAIGGFGRLLETVERKAPGDGMKPVEAALGIVVLPAGPKIHEHATAIVCEGENDARMYQLTFALGKYLARRNPDLCYSFFLGMVSHIMQQPGSKLPEWCAVVDPASRSEDEALYAEYCVGRSRGADHDTMVFLDERYRMFRMRWELDHLQTPKGTNP